MQETLKTAGDLRAQYGHGAAAMAEGLAAARAAQRDAAAADQWRRVAAAIRDLERQDRPLLGRRHQA